MPTSRHRRIACAIATMVAGGWWGIALYRVPAQAQDSLKPAPPAPGSLDKVAIRRPGVLAPEATPGKMPAAAAPTPVEVKAPASPAAPAAATETPPPKPGGKVAAASGAEVSTEPVETISPEMAALFPPGRIFEGVRIPSYSDDSLGSVIHSQYLKRADEEHLELEMMEIVVYQAGQADSRILADRAIFDTVAKTLRSTTPARIVNAQFDMRGDRMMFDSTSRTGQLTGNVKTVILNCHRFGKKSAEPPRSVAPPAPAPTE